MFKVVDQAAAGPFSFELYVILDVFLDLFVFYAYVFFGDLVGEDLFYETDVLEIGLQQGVEVAS